MLKTDPHWQKDTRKGKGRLLVCCSGKNFGKNWSAAATAAAAAADVADAAAAE